MKLWEFGGVDYTRLIRVPDYQINRLPVYTQWTDGNGVVHRDLRRWQLSGSLTVIFDSAAAQTAFFAALNAAMADTGYLSCSLYANNMDAVYAADCYVDFTPKNELPLVPLGKAGGIQIKITER